MVEPFGNGKLTQLLAQMLRRPRVLKPQTLRHLEKHLDSDTSRLNEFLAQAARQLEDYEVEILFAPIFTPTFEEQLEVVAALPGHLPRADQIAILIREVAAAVDACPILLPEGGTAPLSLHPVLIERYVHLLHLENAPAADVVGDLESSLPSAHARTALALMRQKGFTPRHQCWFAEFLIVAANRHDLDSDLLRLYADFLASQPSIDLADLLRSLDQLLKATMDTGAFAQKGRTYWSMDVAEHHNFRGAGAINSGQVEKSMKELRQLEQFKADLEAYGDLGLDYGKKES